MSADSYSIARLVSDLRQVRTEAGDEREILSRVRPLAQKAALAKNAWVEKRFYEADATQGFGVYLLHEEPDHTLAIFALSWLPNRGTPPHDHGTWAVVAGLDGPEKNEFFERADDRSRPGYAELKKIGEKVFDFGDVLAMPQGVIHKVWNASDAVTLSLHIYGKHINHTPRSQFDPDSRSETPFIVNVRD